MEIAGTLASILAVLIVGVMSPGPSFLLVAQTAVGQSRRAAMASALGMAAGATVLCCLALLGLHALFQQFPRAYLVLKIVGALYLLRIAYKMWAGATTEIGIPEAQVPPRSPLRHFAVAMGVMLTNPKAAVQYGVVFGSFLPQHPSRALVLLLPPCVFIMEAGWYTLVACVLSAPVPRNSYLGAKRYIDRGAAVVLGGFGLKLLASI